MTDLKPQQAEASRKPFASFDAFDDRQLTAILMHEHPQTLAMILRHMDDTEKAFAVLNSLPGDLAVDVAQRIADIDKIQPGVLEEVESVIVRELEAMGPMETSDGFDALSRMLASSGQATTSPMFKGIEDKHPELANRLKGRIEKPE